MRKNCDIIKDIIPMYATKIKGYGIIVADLDDKADITPCLESCVHKNRRNKHVTYIKPFEEK